MLRIFPLIAALTLLMLLPVGCKNESKSPPAASPVMPGAGWLEGKLPTEVNLGTPVKGGTFTIRMISEPNGLTRLHDRFRDAMMTRYTLGPLYETLFELDRDTAPRYELKPLLAESVSMSRDKLTQTVKLRKDVVFHNGEPFTSRDVKAVMDVVMNEKNATANIRAFFVDLASWEAPDPHTFVLRWKRPYYLGFRNFAAALPMLPASALTGDFDTLAIHRSPIGTGPFRFHSWEPGKAITLARNDAYWGASAHLDRVVLRFVRDHTVATQLFQRGEFDLMTFIQPSVWKSLESGSASNAWAIDGYNRIRAPENNYSWLGWNQLRPWFKDARVRRALAMLYPTEQVAKGIDLGLEIPTTCPFFIESENCDPTVKRLPYDIEGAKKLLEEAGWRDTNGDGVLDRNGIPFTFTFLTSASSVKLAKLAPLLQQEYRKVGIKLEIERLEWAVYLQRMRRHDFDMGAQGWSEPDVEQDVYPVFHSSQTGASNYVSFSNAKVDALLEQSRREFDPAKRVEIHRALHRLLYEEQVYNFLTVRQTLDMVKKHVRGISPSIAWYDLRKVWLEPKEPPAPKAVATEAN